jgi:uncharacterized membrane protein YqjE
MAEIRADTRGDSPVRQTAGAPPPQTDASLGELFRQLATDSSTLIRQEMALARAEMRENVKSAARGVTAIAIGGVLATVGLLTLTAFLVILLGQALANYWLAALLVGAALLVVGGILVYSNLIALSGEELKPEHTIDSLKEDKEWLQQEIRDAKREMT